MEKTFREDRLNFIQEEKTQLKKRSGSIGSTSKLVSFLYELMRDEVPAGIVERILNNSTGPESEHCTFTNGYLAQYAIDVAKRLE